MTNFSQSKIKQFRRCQKQYAFRYDYPAIYGNGAKAEMVPTRKKLPLYRGSWMHALQEAHHRSWAGIPEWEQKFGEGRGALIIPAMRWQDVQGALTEQYNGLFDEEKEDLGDLPEETERLFRSYLRFWRDDEARYKVATLPGTKKPAIEFLIEMPLKQFGFTKDYFRGTIDLLVEDMEYGGLWVWDAKWVSRIAPPDERMMSPQALLYVWALRKHYGLDVRGFVYNYGRTKPPAIPRVLTRPAGMLSLASRMDTDYHTYLTRIKEVHGDKWKRYIPYYLPKLRELQGREGLWFDRARIPVEDERILNAVREFLVSVRDIKVREKRREYVPRTYIYSCPRGCDYHSLCAAEFQGIEIAPLVKQSMQFTEERYDAEDLLKD